VLYALVRCKQKRL